MARELIEMPPAFPEPSVTASFTVREQGKEPIELDVSVLKLQPGDTLVLSVPGPLRQEIAERIKASAEEYLKDKGVKAMVLGDGMTIDGVLR